LAGLQYLEELHLQQTPLTPAGLLQAAEISSLKAIYIQGCKIPDQAVAKFQKLAPTVIVVRE
jgi:hypothetical protein